jgi:lipoprotein signal peptidase
MLINHKAAFGRSHDANWWMLLVIRILICGLVAIIHSDIARSI